MGDQLWVRRLRLGQLMMFFFGFSRRASTDALRENPLAGQTTDLCPSTRQNQDDLVPTCDCSVIPIIISPANFVSCFHRIRYLDSRCVNIVSPDKIFQADFSVEK